MFIKLTTKHTILTFLLITSFKSFCQNLDNISKEILYSTVAIYTKDGSGSGFLIGKNQIITNLHVIEGSTEGYVIPNGKQEKHKIEGYYAIDSDNDLVILSVPTLNAQPLKLAKYEVKKGEEVFIIDNKLNTSKLLSRGKVSYTGEALSNKIFKTSIPVNFGNSGSAIFNKNGEVVGVVFSGLMTPDNLSLNENFDGYAISLNILKSVISKKSFAIQKLTNIKGANYYYSTAIQKSEQLKYDEAISDYDKSIQLNQNKFGSFYNRGLLKLQIKEIRDLKSSIADFDNVTRIVPEFAFAYNNKGLAKILLKDYNGAINDFDKAIAIDPTFSLAYTSRCLAKSSNEDFNSAINDCDKAIEIEPNNGDYYFNRGGIKYFSGDKKGGCADFEISKNLGSSNSQILYEKFCGNKMSAKEYFEKAKVYENNGNYKGAIADYTNAIKINPNLAIAYNNRGNSKSEIKDYKGAIADFNKAIEINPIDSFAYNNRGLVKVKLKDYNGAILDFNKAISIDPKDYSSYMARGITQHITGNNKDACSDWTKAKKLGYGRAGIYLKKHCN